MNYIEVIGIGLTNSTIMSPTDTMVTQIAAESIQLTEVVMSHPPDACVASVACMDACVALGPTEEGGADPVFGETTAVASHPSTAVDMGRPPQSDISRL